jgi:hypothetical protein
VSRWSLCRAVCLIWMKPRHISMEWFKEKEGKRCQFSLHLDPSIYSGKINWSLSGNAVSMMAIHDTDVAHQTDWLHNKEGTHVLLTWIAFRPVIGYFLFPSYMPRLASLPLNHHKMVRTCNGWGQLLGYIWPGRIGTMARESLAESWPLSSGSPKFDGKRFFFLHGEGPRSRCYGHTTALRLFVQPYDEDEQFFT